MASKYNPFTGNFSVFDEAKGYGTVPEIVTAYTGDTFVVTHPSVKNMGLIPLG